MSRKLLGVLVVVGLLIALVSATADMIGIGKYRGFGRYQITGTLTGAILAIGAWVGRTRIPSAREEGG